MDLKITIGADLSAAIAQVNALTAAIGGLNSQVGGAASSSADMLAKIPAALRPINPASLISLSAAVKQLKADIGGFKTPLIPPIPPIPPSVVPALKNIPPAAKGAGQALLDLGRIAQDAPFGFIGISNNISPLLESFTRLRASTGSTGGALKALFTGLGGAGGLGLAVSAITAAVTFASIGFDRWIPKIKEAKKEVVDLDTIIRSGASIQSEATASVDSQIVKVQALARVVSDESKSYAERNNALGQLKETNKSYYGDLDLEAAKTGLLTARVNEYTRALVAQAVVKGFQDDIGKVSTERAKAFQQLKDQNKVYDDLKKKADESNAAASKNNGQGSFGNLFDSRKLEAARGALGETLKTYQDLDKQFGFLATSIDGAVKETLKFKSLDTGGKTKQETDLLAQEIKNYEKLKEDVGLTSEQFKKLISLRLQLVARDKDKNGLNADQFNGATTAIKYSNEQLEDLKKNLDAVQKRVDLLNSEKLEALNFDIGIALNDQKTGKLDASQTQRAIDKLAKDANLRLPVTIAINEVNKSEIRSRFGALPAVPLNIDVEKTSVNAKAAISAINTNLATQSFVLPSVNLDNLQKGLNKAKASVESTMEGIRAAIESSIENAIIGVSEGIGNAIASGNIGDALKSVGQVLAEGMKSIGQAMIVYGVSLTALKSAIKTPALAIIAGAGLVIAGQALQASIAQHKFAQGGIVTGPTNALIGEAGSEVVFPLNQINKFLPNMRGQGDQSSGFIAETRLSGTDIIIAIRRELGRPGGSLNGPGFSL